jgi:hypothetical protein
MSAAVLPALALVAALYATVGHAGASGYIAVLTLAGMAAPEIRPLALLLNVLVASLATRQFASAGHLRPALLPPLLAASVPAAALGGAIALPVGTLQRLLAAVLLFSAWRLCGDPWRAAPSRGVPAPAAVSLTGGLLGLLAGLTGTGGGIFLTPWMILRGWLAPRQAAAVSAAFILVNSLAGLAGLLLRRGAIALPPPGPLLGMALAVIAGGGLGAWCGSRVFPPLVIRRLLAAVLVVASVKLLLPAGQVWSPTRLFS